MSMQSDTVDNGRLWRSNRIDFTLLSRNRFCTLPTCNKSDTDQIIAPSQTQFSIEVEAGRNPGTSVL